MRCTIVLVLLSIMLSCPLTPGFAGAETKPPPNHVEYLRQVLKNYSTEDTVITKWATAVRGRFPLYEQWMSQAHDIGRRGVYRMDIILQRHEVSNMTLRQELQMHYSQLRIRQLLDSLDCQVVGVENLDLERLTWPGLEQVVILEARDYHGSVFEVDTTHYQLVLLRSIWRMNGLTYFAKHPNAMMLGTEDLPLHRLQMAVIRNMSNQPFFLPVDSAQVNLFWALVRARSELAVVKTLRAMAKRYQTRGAIVIGLGHRPELEEIPKRYHLRAIIYHTDVPERLPSGWWK